MRRNIAVAFAFAAVVGAAACNDGATEPQPRPAEDGFETLALETVGIAEDQANGTSVVPSSAGAEVALSSAAAHGSCTFVPATGRITCPDITRGGVTISRSYALWDAAGTVQQKHDENTFRVNTQVWARGTVAVENGKVTIDRKSDLTATGVQRTSTRRTLNGTEQGSSAMEHESSRGKVVSQVVFGDTTVGLVLPQNDPAQKWPLAGTVIRSHSGTRSLAGSSASSAFSYRAVLVYDGTSKVKVTVTIDGQTRECVRDLESRRHSCGA